MKLRGALLMAFVAVRLGSSSPALGAAPAPATAAADEVDVEVDAGVAQRWPVNADPSQTARIRAPALDGPGPVRLRWGADLLSGPGAGVRPFVGVGLAAGDRTTLFYEHAGEDTPQALTADAAFGDAARMGFEFRMHSRREAWREVGSLRMQLGMNSRLSVKPRRGGVKLTLQAHF